ncbi:hypothetical protein HPP92_009220 [Vanilla planifolia]|uniref:DNA-directed RNA polymerase I subunit rpa49 n=1 Tax=Vanilla planifolia TaxID=51239 RepID=A0A835RFF7_VANPL|nr:hypothetical protein HPP92_009220 [Vanilla planifolia]
MEEGKIISSKARSDKKKKRKTLELEMEVLTETAERMAPVVGYFPSGYDPVAEGGSPDVKVYRNKKKPSRFDLVVRPGGANVEFVGKNYAGEAAAPQLATYALGVLDKETQTLKIVPIASNKILRLEPRVINAIGAPTEINKENIDEGENDMLKNLIGLYGTKRAKKWAKWMSINKKVEDPSLLEHLESGIPEKESDAGASGDVKEAMIRNIPPYNSSAETPEDVYPLNSIITKVERNYLLDILEMLEIEPKDGHKEKFWAENHYPHFVINRLDKLREMKDEAEKIRYACLLSYITHLVNFHHVTRADQKKVKTDYSEAMSKFKIPPIVYHKLLTTFLDPRTQMLSSERLDLLINHILVLTLFADDFLTCTADIEKDLMMPSKPLKGYFFYLGCKRVRGEDYKNTYMTLPVPPEFQELKQWRAPLQRRW